MWGLLYGIGAVMGVGSSLYASKKASTEARYNDRIKREQAQMVGEKQKISAAQWDRDISRAGSTLVANVGASGITMSGSPLTALVDLQTQMEWDKQIEQFNLEWEKRGIISEADAYSRQARTVKQVGYANAFSSLLTSGYNYYGKK